MMMMVRMMALLTLLPYERWKEAQPADISDRSKNFVCRIYLSLYSYLYLSLYSYLYLSHYFNNNVAPLFLFIFVIFFQKIFVLLFRFIYVSLFQKYLSPYFYMYPTISEIYVFLFLGQI